MNKILTLFSCFIISALSLAEQKFVTIGTGGQTGVYYVVGQSICRLVNRSKGTENIKCTAPSTGGSIANLNAIRNGEISMGVAQSDWQFHSFKGTSKFKDQGPDKNLKAVFSVHSEPFTILARKKSGIKNIKDLVGKRINIGNPGSGARATFEVLMKEFGWNKKTFKLVSELKSSEQAKALCDNNVDAIIFAVGHPSGTIQEATSNCESNLVSVTGPEVDNLIKKFPYYASATIPGKIYKGNDKDISTFGVGATFVSSATIPEATIYTVVKSVFDNFERFKKLHPAFNNLSAKSMIKNNLSAPLHSGATKYYQEKGWL